MKKFALISAIVLALGVIFANVVASIAWFNQPKAPSMFSK
jgi:hypothetical protein